MHRRKARRDILRDVSGTEHTAAIVVIIVGLRSGIPGTG